MLQLNSFKPIRFYNIVFKPKELIMYYQKESKGMHNNYYKTYADNLRKETNSIDVLSIVIRVLAIIFLLTLIIFGYIFVSNQYYLSRISNQTETSKENILKTPKEKIITSVNTIESVANIVSKDEKKLSTKDMSRIVQMVMLKMNDIKERERLIEKKQKDIEIVNLNNTSNRKVVIREEDSSSKKIKFIIVKKGDTLSTIANNIYGDRNSYKKIRDANRDIIKDTNKIFAGQRLRIPI